MNVRTDEYLNDFKISSGTVGVIGQGYVGTAVREFFNGHCQVVVYDKVKPELGTLDDVIKKSHLIFVCVPTPMRMKTGECFTHIVEDVLYDIEHGAFNTQRLMSEFVVVIKSTVPPGFTRKMKKEHPSMRLVFSPEFLTEKNSVRDFKTVNRVVFGGDEADALVAATFFKGVYPERVEEGRLILAQCDPTTAEMVKLYTNGMLMAKVLFANEIHQICQKIGVEYDDVQAIGNLDHRIGSSHTRVPGPDGKLGAGGHCFPKDINNLRFIARELGVPEKLFTAIIERNDDLRPHDWEDMVGRAVTSDEQERR